MLSATAFTIAINKLGGLVGELAKEGVCFEVWPEKRFVEPGKTTSSVSNTAVVQRLSPSLIPFTTIKHFSKICYRHGGTAIRRSVVRG